MGTVAPAGGVAQAYWLPYQRASVGLAREFVSRVYTDLEPEHLERVVGAVSELVTNAVCYGAAMGQQLRLVCHDLDHQGYATLDVVDHSTTSPKIYQLDTLPWDAEGGRGLAMLQAEGVNVTWRTAGLHGKVVTAAVPREVRPAVAA